MTAEDAMLIRLHRQEAGQVLGSPAVPPEWAKRLAASGLVALDAGTGRPRLTAAGRQRVGVLTDRHAPNVTLLA